MTITLNDKDIKLLRCLGNTLSTNVVPVNDVRDFITGLQQKINASAGGAGKKRTPAKMGRKDRYRNKLNAI